MKKITFEAQANELPAGGSSVAVRSTFSPVSIEAETRMSPREGHSIRVVWNRHRRPGHATEMEDFVLEGDVESMRDLAFLIHHKIDSLRENSRRA